MKKGQVAKSLMNGLMVCLIARCGCAQATTQPEPKDNSEYCVAAYVWPSCHDEARSREALWGEGIGEWEIIKKAGPRFVGHDQPKIPLWGYQMDDDPVAWERKINAAAGHGVNAFIFDWYWYDGKPFLEASVNGFLRARNCAKVKFYLMWANHNADGYQWNHYRYEPHTLLWRGAVDWSNFRIIVERVIRQYFHQDNYLKIDGRPVFSIYSLTELVRSFSGLDGTQKALDYFRQEVKKAGFPGLHIQLAARGRDGIPDLLERQYTEGKSVAEIVNKLGINSVTAYHWSGPIVEDYIRWGETERLLRARWNAALPIPYFANVSVGYDDTPRFSTKSKESVVHINNTPESFSAFLQDARDYTKKHPDYPKLITINAWNEWAEGSYLEPDMHWGYSYLEAVKRIMSGKYDDQ